LASAVISLSDYCNIRCTYCFEAKGSSTLRDSSYFDSVLESLAQAFNRSSEPLVYVSFYGGEPLVHYELMREVVERLDRTVCKPVQYRIATNGSLLNDERLGFLLARGFDIQLSVDGPPDVHDRHRRRRNGRGAASTLSFALARIRQMGTVTARMTVTPSTAEDFSKSIGYLVDLGFDEPTRRINFDFDYGAVWTGEALDALEAEAARAADLLRAHYESGRQVYVEPLDRALRPAPKAAYCGAGSSSVLVRPDGDVYSCNRLTPSHASEHRRLMLSRGVVDLEGVERVRSVILPQLTRRESCATCAARSFCDMVCPARVFAGSGSFDVISDAQCAITRIVHRMAVDLKVGAGPTARRLLAETYGLTSVFSRTPLFSTVDGVAVRYEGRP
jgi:uncharacterized protein